MKKLITGLGALGVVLGLASPASAHVEPSIEEAPAGSFQTFTLYVGHGCEDDSPTTKLEVQMPEGVEEVTPQFLPGWEASVDEGDDGLVVTWEGGPLPLDQFQLFGLSLAMPDTPGETALFPAIQTCESGSTYEWTEPTPEGGEEPEHPAPAIVITEASEEGAHGGGEAEATDEPAAETAADPVPEDGSSDTLAVVALVVGVLGLLAGAYAIVSSRRGS